MHAFDLTQQYANMLMQKKSSVCIFLKEKTSLPLEKEIYTSTVSRGSLIQPNKSIS